MSMRRLVDAAGLAEFLAGIAAERPDPDGIVMLCIGTDRSTGDAFGPLLGSRLARDGWPHVYGTLREPCDANRLPDVLAGLPAGKTVIAFDACLGSPANVGKFSVARGPLLPAEAVGKRLPEAGHYSAAAVVAARTAKPYHALMTAPLSLVMDMAEAAAEAAAAAWRMTEGRA
jgi:putative sporulation protein YyaC